MTTENKLAAGPILGAVGGFLVLVTGAFEIWLGLGGSVTVNGFAVSGAFVTGGALGVVAGMFMMLVAGLLWAYPESHVALGGALIVLSLISLLSLEGGFGFGFLLGVLGGTCGVVFGPGQPGARAGYDAPEAGGWVAHEPVATFPSVPSRTGTPPPVMDANGRTHHACPQCGHVSPIAFTLCPQCGRPFGGSDSAPSAPP